MARSKQVSKYPAYFLDLAQAFRGRTEEVSYPFTTERDAMRFRFELYAFKGALRHEKLDEPFADFLASAMVVEGPVLRIIPADATEGARAAAAIMQMLATKGEAPKVEQPVEAFALPRGPGQDESATEDATLAFLKGDA